MEEKGRERGGEGGSDKIVRRVVGGAGKEGEQECICLLQFTMYTVNVINKFITRKC